MTRYLCLSLVTAIVFLGLPVLRAESNVSPSEFADTLQKIIKHQDEQAYCALYVDAKTKGFCSKDELAYVMGKPDAQFSIRQFLLSHPVDVFIRPFTDEAKGPSNHYSLVYFNPELIEFTEGLTLTELETSWLKSFIETEVKLIDGKWQFKDTAFYWASHPAWLSVDDH